MWLLDEGLSRFRLLTADLVEREQQVMLISKLGWQFDLDFLIKFRLPKYIETASKSLGRDTIYTHLL